MSSRRRPRFKCSERWTCVSTKPGSRSEEHTSELQSRLHLVCRLLLEKKQTRPSKNTTTSWKAISRRSQRTRSHEKKLAAQFSPARVAHRRHSARRGRLRPVNYTAAAA